MKWTSILVIVLVTFYFISIVSLHLCTKNELSCVIGNLGKYIYIVDPLEIELLGAGIIATIVSITMMLFEKRLQEEKIRRDTLRYYKEIIMPHLQNALRRAKSTMNTNSGTNMKGYFDNTHINQLFDVIDLHKDRIHEYLEYDSKNSGAANLVKFHKEVESSYRLGEELDIVLFKMAKAINPEEKATYLLFIKSEYAQFPKDEVVMLLSSISGLGDYKTDSKNFVADYYDNPSSDLKKSYKDSFDLIDIKMKDTIANLKTLETDLQSKFNAKDSPPKIP